MKPIFVGLMALLVAQYGDMTLGQHQDIDPILKTIIPVVTTLLAQLLAWILKRHEQRQDKKIQVLEEHKIEKNENT